MTEEEKTAVEREIRAGLLREARRRGWLTEAQLDELLRDGAEDAAEL